MKTFTNLIKRASLSTFNMKRYYLFIIMLLTLGIGNAWAETVSVTLSDGSFADSKITWSAVSGNITITQSKGNGTTAVSSSYISDPRVYKGHILSFEAKEGYKIKQIELKCNSTYYGNSMTAGTVIANNVVTNNTAEVNRTWATTSGGTHVISSVSADGLSAIHIQNVASTNVQLRFAEMKITYVESGSTPPTPTTQYTVKWYTAIGSSDDVKYDEGATITKPATDPTMSGHEFMGWTDQCNVATDGSDFTALTDFGTADSDKDFYAVFALATTTGGGAATETTASVVIKDYASAKSWANSTKYTTVEVDANITASVTGSSNTGKYYTSGYEWRLYQTETAKLIISATEGKTIKTAKITYNVSNTGVLKLNSSNVTSGTTSTINASSVTYNVGNSGSATNGQVKVTAIEVVYTSGSAGSTTYSNYITTCGGSTPTPAVLVSIAKTAGKTEFTEGDTFEKATITATYDDETTKDVTSLATFTGYDMNTTGTQTVNVTYEGKSTSYTITVNPKPKYTITWNNAGTTTTTEVVQGEALGTLPEPADCPSGKKFMGWTAATTVNNDGSGITYIKPTDKPTANTTYYAVFAVVEGGDATPTTATVTIADYATANGWTNESKYLEITVDANITITATGGTNTGKYYTSGTNWRLYQTENPTLTISATASYEIQTVKVTYTYSNAGVLTLDGSNVTSETECTINAESVTFGVGNTGTATNGQVRVTAIEVVYAPAAAKSDYSLDCDVHQDPFLNVTENAIDFGTVAQNETVTKTFTVTGGYLAEDVALTISGTNASFFSVSPATITKADDVEETVTVTYTPTATGDHTATLTIKTGDITKEIALSGKVLTPGKWVLVKDIATLSAGDEIIIASAVADYAIGVAATNNYKGAAITKVGETANTTADVTILTVEETGDAEVPYAFKDGSKYLYAAGSDKNYLKAQVTNNVNGQWAVTITAEGVASIVAAKSTNRNVMQCNPNDGNPIFACYTSAGYQQLAIYRNSENVVKPVISGDADFVDSTQVTITAQSGLTVYYTTDGSDPDNTSTQYTAPFTINATTTVKAIAYDASSNASGVAEMTFTKHELVNVATAMALEQDVIAYFDEFEVVKVVTGKGNIYIKDASGHGLIYDNTLAGELKDGDRVQGFVGISSPYNGLPEAKPVDGLKVADLTITSGVAAEPYDFTSTAIAEADINKYIVFNDVAIAANTDVSTNPTLTIGGNNVKFYNQFGISKTLEAGKTYDIYGFVAIYNSNLQVYFYQALEEGEVVTKYTVTYNAGGATGEVPVDDNEYTEGAQVYLKSATGLTKEGYDYKGWKVTDEGGNEIVVSSNKFNMPASNVTVTAQWEEIVAPEIQDFSTGYWVLVTDANKIADGDKIVIAAADENFAMKSYESGNNCRQVAVTKLGDQLLKWTSEIGVFQLIANGSNYTIQDVNTEKYLYAAGTGNNNYLKAAGEVPDADAAKPYIWTISYTDGVATVKATSDNRNTLMYNTGSDLFSCYASGQQDIALYKYVDTYTYTRNVTNKFGTICLPYASASTTGAYFYEVAGTEEGKVYLASVNSLEAGVPYIFEATEGTITVTCQGTPVAEAGTANGLIGTFTNETEVPEGAYILYNNAFRTTDDPMNPNKINAYRAYLVMEDIVGGKPTQMPGRRYIGMAVEGENAETGLENIIVPEGQAVKVINNGQLIIIRGGEKFNAQGQLIK